jgi:hypothetical protein
LGHRVFPLPNAVWTRSQSSSVPRLCLELSESRRATSCKSPRLTYDSGQAWPGVSNQRPSSPHAPGYPGRSCAWPLSVAGRGAVPRFARLSYMPFARSDRTLSAVVPSSSRASEEIPKEPQRPSLALSSIPVPVGPRALPSAHPSGRPLVHLDSSCSLAPDEGFPRPGLLGTWSVFSPRV